MADDIDIVEHDVLDHAKQMYPDLTIVKTELMLEEHDEEEFEQNPDNDYQPYQEDTEPISYSTDHIENPFSEHHITVEPICTDPDQNCLNEEIKSDDEICTDQEKQTEDDNESQTPFDGVPDSTTDIEQVPKRTTDSPHVVSSTQDLEFHNNCIILGSRPNSKNAKDMDAAELDKCYSVALVLKNWGGYLANSNSYCKECEILFATVNAFDAHKMAAHSFLVAVEPEAKPIRREVKKDCFVCKKEFFNEAELIQHIYLHIANNKCDECERSFATKQLLDEHLLTHQVDQVSPTLSFRCDKCSCYYHRQKTYISHMMERHRIKPVIFKRVPEKLDCPFCKASIGDRKRYNGHIFSRHMKVLQPINSVARPRVIVKKPGIVHKAKHPKPVLVKTKIPKSVPSFNDLTALGALFNCTKCDVHFTSYSLANGHYSICSKRPRLFSKCKKCHLNIHHKCASAHSEQHNRKTTGLFDVYNIEPSLEDRLLNKCPRCLVSYDVIGFKDHFNQCNGTSDGVNCDTCKVKIDVGIEEAHKHLHSSLNQDCIISMEYFEPRVPPTPMSKRPQYKFYVCRKCNCFLSQDKLRYTGYHLAGQCEKSTLATMCDQCGILLTKNTKSRHLVAHETLPQYEIDNFLVYCLETKQQINPLPVYPRCDKCDVHFHASHAAVHHKCGGDGYKKCPKCSLKFSHRTFKLHMKWHSYKTEKIQPLELKKARKSKKSIADMFYCFKCNCCLHSNLHFNKTSSCTNDKCVVCNECGLKFTLKAIKAHKIWHREANIGLDDIKFFRTPDGAPITPPMPVYYNCKLCKVYFHSKIARRIHNCGRVAHHQCDICHISLTTEAYALHTKLHTVLAPEPEVAKRQVFFYCNVCKCCVLNAGSHLNLKRNCKNLEKRTCHHCGLYFTLSVLKYHHLYHKKYPENQLQNFTFLRLHDRKKISPPIPDYHSCKKCRVHFYMKSLLKFHKCGKQSYEMCNICNIKLCIRGTYNLHMAFHKFASDGNKPIDVYKCNCCHGIFPRSTFLDHKNDKKPCAPDDASLQHCDGCDKRISKPYFAEHFKAHERMRIKEFERPFYSFYKCKTCQTCYEDEASALNHKCDEEKEICSVCDLTLPTSAMEEHLLKHDGEPLFGQNKFVFQVFENAKKNSIYQCKTCGICLWRETSIVDHFNAKECKMNVWSCNLCHLKVKNSKSHLKFHAANPNFDSRDLNFIVVGNVRDVKLCRKGIARRTVTLFQCEKCNYVAFENIYRYKHRKLCTNFVPQTLSKCDLCELPLRPQQTAIHKRFHAKHPNVRPSDIRLIGFTPAAALPKPAQNNLQKPSNRISLQFYQCSACTFVAFLENSMAKHCSRCSGREMSTAVTCALCQLPVRTKQKDIHARLHELNPNMTSKTIRVIQVDPKGSAPAVINGTKFEAAFKANQTQSESPIKEKQFEAYKCNSCKRVTFKKQFMINHERFGCKKPPEPMYRCRKCRLIIPCQQKANHNIYHKNNPGLTASNVRVIAYGGFGEPPIEPAKDIHSDDSHKDIAILRCSACDICFVSHEDVELHIKDNHVVDDVANCAQCGLAFFKYVLPQHIVLHHADGNQLEDFSIQDVALPRKVLKRRHSGELVPPTITDVYQCDCGLTFICSKSLNDHVGNCKGTNDTGLRCSKCELVFDSKQLLRHSLKHHGLNRDFKYNIIRKDPPEEEETNISDRARRHSRKVRSMSPPVPKKKPRVVLYSNSVYYCESCDVHFLKQNTLSKHLRPHVLIKQSIACEVCHLRFSKHSLTIHKEEHHESGAKETLYVRDLDENVIKIFNYGEEADGTQNNTVEKEIVVQEVIEKAKVVEPDRSKCLTYYKCRDCDVVFLKQKSYQKHVINHVAMEEYDYLECKICKMNVVVESLKTHMEHHKNNLFSFDTVAIIDSSVHKVDKTDESLDVDVCSDSKTADDISNKDESDGNVEINEELDSTLRNDEASTSKEKSQKILLVFKN